MPVIKVMDTIAIGNENNLVINITSLKEKTLSYLDIYKNSCLATGSLKPELKH